ncbi:MAG: class I SAM-dependent methyltransferase [Flavobacteriales bacterium]|jgi:cyclopropane fatty-acyl-phospholipid synthase-like methyltransferase|nr:class I SAM-dependent methyltransferase [Flavobacteriales bacterium]
MLEMWNTRYKAQEFAYGKEPNQFFKQQLDLIPTNETILFPAEGEGRNAVYAAIQGHQVYAFDISIEGRNKAQALAKENNTNIDYQVGQLQDLNYTESSFDSIVLIYAHLPTTLKKSFYTELIKLLKPNGRIILEGFSKKHLAYSTQNPEVGGPKNIDMLFSKETITEDFSTLETIFLEETDTILKEGKFHNGKSAVIRYIGQKK